MQQTMQTMPLSAIPGLPTIASNQASSLSSDEEEAIMNQAAHQAAHQAAQQVDYSQVRHVCSHQVHSHIYLGLTRHYLASFYY